MQVPIPRRRRAGLKFAYNLQRPVTYIRANIDANWLPPLVTPPFPTYASGHSTQSGAVATVLEAMFGRMAFRDTLHQDHGLTPALEARAFRSFAEARAKRPCHACMAGSWSSRDTAATATADGPRRPGHGPRSVTGSRPWAIRAR